MSDFARILADELGELTDNRSAAAPNDPLLAAFERELDAMRTRAFVASPRMCAAAQELGLELPCTAQDIARAFRRLAFKTHPDRPGGSHEAFLRAKALFREAVDALEEQAVAAPPAALASRFRAPPARAIGHSVYA
jgi:hypothetical protein